MPWVKKISDQWVTNPNHLVGEKVFVTNAERLVAEGKAVYIDELGNEISRGESTKCPICTFSTNDAYELADHIYKAHPKSKTPVVTVEVEGKNVVVPNEKKFKDMTPEEQKAWRIANLKKGREAAQAKKEAELTAKAVKEAVEIKNA